MTRTRTAASLELEQDDRILQREWRFERVGWGAIALVLVAGFTGLLGDGAFASASVASADGGTVVRYERIVRHGAPSRVELRLAPASRADTVAVVSLSEDYHSDMDVQRVSPVPLRVRASSGRVEYHLLHLDPGQPMTVVFSIQAGSVGMRRAAVGTRHGVVELRQLVLP